MNDSIRAHSPVHLFAGMWGLMAPAFFASQTNMVNAYGADEGYYGMLLGAKFGHKMFACQLLALVVILAWVFIQMIPFFYALEHFGIFRVSVEQESDGLGELVSQRQLKTEGFLRFYLSRSTN
jgi:Amt family ammonium transporter